MISSKFDAVTQYRKANTQKTASFKENTKLVTRVVRKCAKAPSGGISKHTHITINATKLARNSSRNFLINDGPCLAR